MRGVLLFLIVVWVGGGVGVKARERLEVLHPATAENQLRGEFLKEQEAIAALTQKETEIVERVKRRRKTERKNRTATLALGIGSTLVFILSLAALKKMGDNKKELVNAKAAAAMTTILSPVGWLAGSVTLIKMLDAWADRVRFYEPELERLMKERIEREKTAALMSNLLKPPDDSKVSTNVGRP